jgi:hypothetical protein
MHPFDPMKVSLRPIQANEHDTVCAWAMAEQWPGLEKGQQQALGAFSQIITLPGHQSYALSAEAASAIGFGHIAEALRLPATTGVKLRVRHDNFLAVRVYQSLGFATNEAESNDAVMAMTYDA